MELLPKFKYSRNQPKIMINLLDLWLKAFIYLRLKAGQIIKIFVKIPFLSSFKNFLLTDLSFKILFYFGLYFLNFTSNYSKEFFSISLILIVLISIINLATLKNRATIALIKNSLFVILLYFSQNFILIFLILILFLLINHFYLSDIHQKYPRIILLHFIIIFIVTSSSVINIKYYLLLFLLRLAEHGYSRINHNKIKLIGCLKNQNNIIFILIITLFFAQPRKYFPNLYKPSSIY